MLDVPLALPELRTLYSDEAYAALGRALSFATQFEADCRAFALYLKIQDTVHDPEAKFSLGNREQLSALADAATKKQLFANVQEILRRKEIELVLGDSLGNILHGAREARNTLVHEFTRGIWHQLEASEGRARLLADLKALAADLAVGHLYIGLMMLLSTEEDLPTDEYLRGYRDAVVAWVSKVFDE